MMRYFSLLLLTVPLSASLTLEEAEHRALKTNIAIQISDQDLKQNDARRLQAVLSWLPEITFGSMYAKLQKSQKISHLQKQNHLFSNQLALTQPIFSPGLLGDLRLSEIAQTGARIGKDMIINDTLLQVRLLFLAALLKQQTVDVEKEVIGYLNTSYEAEQKKYSAGSSTTLLVSQTKSALSQEITKYYGAMKELSDAKQQLGLSLHLDADEAVDLKLSNVIGVDNYPLLKEKLELLKKTVGSDVANPAKIDAPFAVFSPEEVQDWINLARQDRPELKQSHVYVQAAQEKFHQSKRQYLPKIEAFVDYGYYQPINGQFLRQRNDFAGGIQLSWSLFDSFKREARVGEVYALKKAAGLALEYESDKVASTIRNDINQLEEALFVYLYALEAAELAQQALEETKVRLSSGSITDLDLQKTTRLQSEAQLHKLQAEYNYLKSYFQLRHDAGIDAHS